MPAPKFFPSLHRRFVVNCTTRCNFSCSHCIRKVLDENKAKYIDIPLPLFKECLKEFKKINYRLVAFTGGEPILHPDFGKLIESAAKENFFFSVISNGWLYRDYFPVLKKYRPRLLSIAFSLDASRADLHDKIRNKSGSYEKVIEAIKFYKKSDFRVFVSTCFNQENLSDSDIVSLYKLLVSLKVNTWRIAGVQQIDNNDERLGISAKNRLSIWRKIIKLKKSGNKNSLNIDFCTSIKPDIFPPDIYFCRNFSVFEPVIHPDGAMMFCCDIYKTRFNCPSIIKDGFWRSFRKNLKIVEELKKRRLEDILKNNLFDGFDTCDFCDKYIEKILRPPLK